MIKLKLGLVLILFIGTIANTNAQKINNIKPSQNGNTIDISFNISGAKFYEVFNIELFVSFDGGENFQGPMKSVTGDTKIEKASGSKSINWNAFKDVSSLEGELIFDVRAKTESKEVDKHFFIQYSAGAMLSSIDYVAPLGIMFGQTGKIGWFTAIRLNSLTQADYSFDGESMDKDILYEFNNVTKYTRASATAGILYQLNWSSFAYAGIGYGYKKHLQQIEELSYTDASSLGNKWVELESNSSSGIEIELGGMMQFKQFNASLGAFVYNFEHIGLNVGVGYQF